MNDDRPDPARRRLSIGLACVIAGGAGLVRATLATTATTGSTGTSAAAFPLFDALLFRKKPNLARRGLMPMAPIADVWRQGVPRDDVDEPGLAAALARVSPDATVFVDIENWPLVSSGGRLETRSIDNYLRTAEIIRTRAPRIKFGFYGAAPDFAYWPIVRDQGPDLAAWRSVNRALRPVANSVDFILPCLYTPYADPPSWRKFAGATLEEARQFGKPVYPFLWNEYFDANPLLAGQQIKDDDWRDELQFCRQHADGIVLWGGSEKNWNENSSWWRSVLDFRRGAGVPTRG